jgi:hypothetical protein
MTLDFHPSPRMYVVTRHDPSYDFCVYIDVSISKPLSVYTGSLSACYALPDRTLVTGPQVAILASLVLELPVVLIPQADTSWITKHEDQPRIHFFRAVS